MARTTSRRRLLALLGGAAATATAGCAALADREPPTADVGTPPVLAVRMDAVTDHEIAERATYDLDRPMRTDERRLALQTIRDGPVRRTVRNGPLPENRSFVHDGAVWELSEAVVESAPATAYRLTLSETDGGTEDAGDAGTAGAGGDETIAYTKLSDADQRNLERYGWHEGGPFQAANVVVTYREDAVEDSALVPQPDAPALTWESGESARISVDGADDAQFTTYEYTASQVRESAAELGRSIREDVAFALDARPRAERDVLSAAVTAENGYIVQGDEPPPAARDLVERIGRHDRIDRAPGGVDESSVSGKYLVRYDGNVYWTELRVRRDSEWV